MNNTNTTGEALDLNKLEALAKAATRGPWKRSERPNGPFWHISSEYTIGGERCKSGRQAIGAIHAESKRGAVAYAAMFEANASFIAAANPAAILELIALARAGSAALARRRTVTNPDGSTTTYISVYENSLEMDLAECRDLFEVPESGELHDLWSEACSEPRAVAAYVKAQFAAIKSLAAPTAAEGPSEQTVNTAMRAYMDASNKGLNLYGCIQHALLSVGAPTAPIAQQADRAEDQKDARIANLRAALQQISETRFGYDGDCGTTRIADDALYEDEVAAQPKDTTDTRRDV